jgi:hypothetical protein
MEKIQVLALDDDYHDTNYVTKDHYYYNVEAFMKRCLLKPHDKEYEVRIVRYIDLEEDSKEMMAFDYLHCGSKSSAAFDILWKVSKSI